MVEALSFQTASNPRPAKQLKPPHNQANASYWKNQIKLLINQMFYRYEFNPHLLFKFQNTIRKIEEIHLPDCIRNTIDTRFRQISPIVPRKLVVYMKLKSQKKKKRKERKELKYILGFP